ncbi:MAG: ABC transporter permease [Planctomycetota bacterium]
MHSALSRYTRREYRRRPGRTLLTLAGIVIGVATMVSILNVIANTRRLYRDMFDEVAGRATLEIVNAGFAGFDARVLDTVTAIAGVEHAAPVVQVPAALRGVAGPALVAALGIDAVRDSAVRPLVLRSGRFLRAVGDEALLEAGFAAQQGVQLGDRARLVTLAGVQELEVVGLLEPTGAARFNGGSAVFLSLGTAQRCFGLAGQLTSLQLVLASDARADDVTARLRAVLPAGLSVQAPALRGAMSGSVLASLEQGLSLMSVVSLVAGGFVVLNSFLMSLNERRRQLAILRALGATRRQIVRLIQREALLLGGVGTVLGVVVGIVLMRVLQHALNGMLGVRDAELRLDALSMGIGLIVGPSLALVACAIPARSAARRDPLAVMLEHGAQVGRRGGERGARIQGFFGVGLLAVALGFEALFLTELLSPVMTQRLIPIGTIALLVGCVLGVPLFLRPLLRVFGRLLRPALGVIGKLAFLQLERHRERTSLTVGVLLIAVAIAVGIGNAVLNNIRDTREWFEHTIAYDFFVRGAMPDAGTMQAVALPDELKAEIEGLPGIAHVAALNFVPATANGAPVLVLARSIDPARPGTLDLLGELSPAEANRRLAAGEVLVGSVLAQRLKLKVGDSLELATRTGAQRFQIGGLVTEYTSGGMAVWMSREPARVALGIQGAHVFTINATPGEESIAAASLAALVAARELVLQSNDEFWAVIDFLLGRVIRLFWLLMLLMFVVASMGTVNTLVMNVLEQTRELGVLRTIALKRRQVLRLVVGQAFGMSMCGILPGLVVGLLLAVLVNLASRPITGYEIELRFELAFIAFVVVGAFAVTLVAALLPARRAARLEIIEALKYE